MFFSPSAVFRHGSSIDADQRPRPILTPKTVLPLFFTIGIIFAPIGGLLLYASAQVRATSSAFPERGAVLICSGS